MLAAVVELSVRAVVVKHMNNVLLDALKYVPTDTIIMSNKSLQALAFPCLLMLLSAS